MPNLVFDTCCGCIELRSGCLIIGYVQLVLEIIGGIALILALSAAEAIKKLSEKDHNRELEEAGTMITVTSAITLTLLIIALAFTITMLVGVHQRKRGHVKAYLIYSCIFLVISTITFLVGLYSRHDAGHIIGNIISILLSVYFLLVIRSYYLKMDENKPTIYSTA